MNAEVVLTLDDAVGEVAALLTGLDRTFLTSSNRYRVITRALNRALKANALEREWAYYADTEQLGSTQRGVREVALRASVRPRIVSDDAVRLVDEEGTPRVWAYFLPRDALHKYSDREGLWCAVTRSTLQFSRPFTGEESGLVIELPVMREPRIFRLPEVAEESSIEATPVPEDIREQLIDFDYPDVIVARAAYFYAQSDPVMQPRVQTLESEYKDLMYQLIERDERHTDSPYINDFSLGISSDIYGSSVASHRHPHSQGRVL